MKNKKVYKTTLRLHDINHLFDDPNISPFSDYYQPYSFKTGMDYIVDELYSHPSAEEIELTVLLPEAWAQNARQGQDIARYKGMRAQLRDSPQGLAVFPQNMIESKCPAFIK
jgi:nitrate reductase beta subunit